MKKTLVLGKPLPAMTLGTVQLGMNYGIANQDGKPNEEKSFAILRTAIENGAASLDTARAYGDSEDVIGRFLKTLNGERPFITTKIPVAKDPMCDIEKHVVSCMEESLRHLGIKKADCVLTHNQSDLYDHGEKLARAMEHLVKLGYTDQVGVSVYNREDAEEMLRYPQFTAIQVPMSIFDQRLIASGTIRKLKDAGYTVFVRSVFLQGLFFLDPDKVTDPILLDHAVPGIRSIRELAASEGMSVAQLAVTFMRDCAGVTSLVLGADSPEQVRENISCFEAPPISASARKRLESEFSGVDIPEIMKVLSRPKSQN